MVIVSTPALNFLVSGFHTVRSGNPPVTYRWCSAILRMMPAITMPPMHFTKPCNSVTRQLWNPWSQWCVFVSCQSQADICDEWYTTFDSWVKMLNTTNRISIALSLLAVTITQWSCQRPCIQICSEILSTYTTFNSKVYDIWYSKDYLVEVVLIYQTSPQELCAGYNNGVRS